MNKIRKFIASVLVIAMAICGSGAVALAATTSSSLYNKAAAGITTTTGNHIDVPSEWLDVLQHYLDAHQNDGVLTDTSLDIMETHLENCINYIAKSGAQTKSEVIASTPIREYVISEVNAASKEAGLGVTASANVKERTITIVDSKQDLTYSLWVSGSASAGSMEGHAVISHTGASNLNLLFVVAAVAVMIGAAVPVVMKRRAYNA